MAKNPAPPQKKRMTRLIYWELKIDFKKAYRNVKIFKLFLFRKRKRIKQPFRKLEVIYKFLLNKYFCKIIYLN